MGYIAKTVMKIFFHSPLEAQAPLWLRLDTKQKKFLQQHIIILIN